VTDGNYYVIAGTDSANSGFFIMGKVVLKNIIVQECLVITKRIVVFRLMQMRTVFVKTAHIPPLNKSKHGGLVKESTKTWKK